EYPPSVDGMVIDDYVDWLRFSMLSVVTTLPSLSMPAGFTQEGLPVGLQLVGPPRGEARLLQVAQALEERLALPTGPIEPRAAA
ncbi:MAG: amidase family protein, partial [Pseudomonadota bacterium]